MSSSEDLHVIVLAGNQEPSLARFTHALSGIALPKQFALIAGDGSLLQQTVASFAKIVPPDNISVVVATEHEDLARTQLHEWPGIAFLPRPLERGAGLDLLLALGRVLARAPAATVMVAPAHHYVPGAEVLVGTLAAATLALTTTPVIVAGAAVESLTQGHRFIVPGPRLDGRVLSVARLVERGSPARAQALSARGALWHTATFVARAAELWRLAASRMAAEARLIADLWARGSSRLADYQPLLRALPSSRGDGELWQLARSAGVVPVHGTGWSEWSSSEQIVDSLDGGDDLERLLTRIYRRQRACGPSDFGRQRLAKAVVAPVWNT